PSTDARTLCAAVTKLGPQSVIIKRGARGAFASVDGACFEQEAVPVPVIDSVGAGDAFVAGYLAATADGADAATRLDRGVRCGAIACASEGDWEGNPTIVELEQLLDDGDPVLR